MKRSGSPPSAAPLKPQGRGKKQRIEAGAVPDDATFVDVEPEEGSKVVGGRFAQYDSGDDDEHGELSVQTKIDKQAEAMLLGQMLLHPDKRRALEDAAYNRHTSNDVHLPSWFLDDERKFNHREGYGLDMDDEMLAREKDKLKDINARSIGKVAEAKGRKQRRQQRALLKLKKKANAVINKEDLSEREKAREVEKMYKRKLEGKKKEKKLIVGRKSSASGSGKTSHGVKYVDARSRSDKRGEQRAEKQRKKSSKGKGKGSKGGGPKKSIVKTKKTKSHTKRR